MTPLLFKNARLIDPETSSDDIGTLAVEDGRIVSAMGLDGARVIDCAGKCLAPGIVDIGVKVSEPGERHKESFRSAGLAAAAGGVTTIVTRPDTLPAIDTPETLEFVRRRANEAAPVNVLPMAALTRGREGREMAEIGFLLDAGAVAFTDCDRVITSSKVFSRCLAYAASLGALVIAHPQEPILSDGAAATSGKFAALRGLPSVSPMAERMALEGLVRAMGLFGEAADITLAEPLPPVPDSLT
ncbi:MAG: dihydroorotase, partial [Pseudomonadota bacterium]